MNTLQKEYYQFQINACNIGIEKAAEYAAKLGFSSVEVFSNCMVEGDLAFLDVESAGKAREVCLHECLAE